jgi:tripartite-type tricarboxylate transporter receptor subunit TctC
MIDRRSFVAGAGAGAAALASGPRPVLAQAGGAPVKIVFPFGAGGGGDAISRLLAEQIAPVLQRTVIVENRTGADGRIGINSVKSAPPDGDTLLITTGPTMWLMPIVHKAPGYDPFTDFEPISHLASFEFCVAVALNTGISSMKELVAWVKANPDKATYALPGAGTIPHFIGVALSKLIGTDMRRLPYRGGAPAMNDLVGGQIPLSVGTLADALQQHRAGKVRIVAVAGKQRSPFLPEVPTLIESGFNIDGDAWYGFWAPAKTPAATIGKLNGAVVGALQKPEVKQRLEALGLVPAGTTAQRLVDLMRENRSRWEPVVRESGYRMDQ